MRLLGCVVCFAFVIGCGNPSPSYSPIVDSIDSFPSEFVDARNIEVFLPRQYFEHPDQRFDVVYMHDGQNVFHAKTAYGGIAWEADSILQTMIDAGQVRPAIIVAVWNNGMLRYNEYCPATPFYAMPEETQDSIDGEYGLAGKMLADDYLSFLTEEVKPYIDSAYRTKAAVEHTFVMGSSMGGLISCYALLERPDVFGGAACLSTHWPFSHEPGPHPFAASMIGYTLRRMEPIHDQRIFYFDLGTETLDSLYPVYQARLDSMVEVRYGTLPNYHSMTFDGGEHNEASWQARLNNPLEILLGKNPSP